MKTARRIRRTTFAAFAALAATAAGDRAFGAEAGAPRELTLVREGVPAAVIVVAQDATRAAQLAAFELQHHLRLITRATLPIVTDEAAVPGVRILVGESAATRKLGLQNDDFAHQEYLIRFLPDTLVLMGRDADLRGRVDYDYLTNPGAAGTWMSNFSEQGTMYAVYDFLEKHGGVRWINPTDFGTLHPRSATLTVKGAELRRRPAMLFRGGSAAGNTGIGMGYGDAARYQYGGGLWRRETEAAQAYMAAAYPRLNAVYPDEKVFGQALRAQNLLFQYRMKAGGDQRQCNHSFYDFYGRFYHKDSKTFEGYHPEYFAQGYEGVEPPQLCYSHPATIAQVVKDARAYFDQEKTLKPGAAPAYKWGRDFVALEPMDNGAYCRCEACTVQFEPGREAEKSQHSTYWFRFVNAVARELRKTHPDKFVSTLAYGSHEGLPTGFKLDPNVAVHFCISANRGGGRGKAALQAQMDRLQAWRDQEPDVPMYLWLYNTFPLEFANNGRYFCYPGFFAREIKRQFDEFRRLGVQGIFHCGFHDEVENFVTYKLMDDPTLDIDKLLNDYFALYGAAGKTMRAWYDLAESRFMDPAIYPSGPDGKPGSHIGAVAAAWEYQGNAETMAKLGALMQEAGAKAKGQAAELVKLWDLGVWSYMRTGRETYVQRMQAPIPSATAARVPSAGGDPGQVAWDRAGDVGDTWYLRGGQAPSKRVFKGRVCHDGEYFYLELVEENVQADQLVTDPKVFCYDVWEPLFARQRAQPFRQYAVGPTGLTAALSHGEVNWRQNVVMPETGFRAVTDTSGGRWVARMSWPLATLVDQPVKPGETLYMNILRTSNPKLAGEPLYGIDTWVSYCTVREVDRLGELKLAP